MSRLVNQLKTEGNLKQYIMQYLSNTYLYNMMTRRSDRAIDIINWNKCYGLNNLFKYKMCPSIKFATRQEYFGRVEKLKDKKDLKKIKEKVVEYKDYIDYEKNFIGIYKSKYYARDISYKYEYAEVVPVTIKDYQPIFKYKIINGKKIYTTQYKEIYIIKYAVIQYIPVTKQKKITRYKTVGYENEVEAMYDYKFKYYIQYFLFEMYREDEKGKVIHECFINPFFSGYSVAEPTFMSENGQPIYTVPTQIYESGTLQAVTSEVQSQIIGKKPKDLREGKTREFFTKERKYKSNYVYDESITDCIFFIDYDTMANNLKIERVF